MSSIDTDEASAILHRYLESTEGYKMILVKGIDMPAGCVIYDIWNNPAVVMQTNIDVTNFYRTFLPPQHPCICIHMLLHRDGIEWTQPKDFTKSSYYNVYVYTDLVAMFQGKIDEFSVPSPHFRV